VKSQATHRAQKECANWNNGKCLGAMLIINQKRKNGYKYQIGQCINVELADKLCIADKGCSYYENFILPGVVDK
jgi:hypothetical protein